VYGATRSRIGIRSSSCPRSSRSSPSTCCTC
jgi:hypothetical protein